MKKRWRMCSAIAFIKSGGTLFPTHALRVVANFLDCRIWTTDLFSSPPYPDCDAQRFLFPDSKRLALLVIEFECCGTRCGAGIE